MCSYTANVKEMGRTEGRAEGRTEGRTEGRADAIERLLKKNMTPEEIFDLLGYPMEEIQEVEESLLASAK